MAVAAFAVLIGACSGSEDITEKDSVPDWYTNPPQDPNHVFAAQAATSQSMQVAIDKATNSARGQIATGLETKIEGLTKSFTEEVGDELRQQYVETQKTITSRVLRGTQAAEKKVIEKDNGTFQAFVLMDMPIGKAAKELMSKIEQNDEMYTRFRASQAFEEMEEAVEEYEREQEEARAAQQGGDDASEGGGNQ